MLLAAKRPFHPFVLENELLLHLDAVDAAHGTAPSVSAGLLRTFKARLVQEVSAPSSEGLPDELKPPADARLSIFIPAAAAVSPLLPNRLTLRSRKQPRR